MIKMIIFVKVCFILVLINLLVIKECVVSLSLKNCRLPLGMQSGEISDDALSASSSFDENTVGPKYSRIRTETNGGAWCPQSQIYEGSYEYLEINLNNLTVITSVETQGRFGNGLGQEYAETYMLEYKREDDKNWIRYRNRQGETLISGNANTYIAEMREISPPILAKRIRFIPYSKIRRTVCLRVELYGCPFQDGIVWYQMPQGDRRSDIDFIDNSYDGTQENNVLKDGLGQLTDGELGDDDYRAETYYFGMKGYEWIGWRRNSDRFLSYKILNNSFIKNNSIQTEQAPIVVPQSLPYVPLAFKFDYLRNFSSILIHCNNMFTKDVQVFNKAIVQFSTNGVFSNSRNSASKAQLIFDIPNDTRNESARFIKLELGHQIARYIRIKLYFASKWLLISEINFNSIPIQLHYNNDLISNLKLNSNEFAIKTTSVVTTPITMTTTSITTTQVLVKSTSTKTTAATTTFAVIQQSLMSSSLKQYYLIILVISVLILFSIFGLIIAVLLLNRQKYKNKAVKLQNIIQQKRPFSDSLYTNIPLNVNLSSELATFLKQQPKFEPTKYLIAPMNTTKNTIIMKSDPAFSTATTSLSSSTSGSDQNPNHTNPLFQPYHLFQTTTESLSDSESREYCSPDITTPILQDCLTQLPKNDVLKSFLSELQAQKALLNEISPYASVDILDNKKNETQESIQGVCGNILFHVENKDQFLKLPPLNQNLQKISTITFLNQVSDGQFGKLYTVSLSDNENSNQLLIAKILINSSTDASIMNKAQQYFLDEIGIRCRLNHPNLANMIGYCENPYCLINEYKSELGHLDEFLKSNNQSISYSTQLFILLQISSAMKYLEELNVTHRDLAIRNCLVYNETFVDSTFDIYHNLKNDNLNLKNIKIKLTDVAICLPQYRKDYYFYNNAKLLPIRYMPAEALFENLYSPSSDTWSFGILIWQLFTNCTNVPFSEWSNNDYLCNLKVSVYSAILNINTESTEKSKEGNDINRPLLQSTTLSFQKNNKSTAHLNSQYSSLKLRNERVLQPNSIESIRNMNKINDTFINFCLNMTTPFNCTKEIHDLLIECCNTNMVKRPKFKDIYLFLQCKLFGAKF